MVRHAIKLKRVYEEASSQDGARILVDRLWPRGIRKNALHLTGWAREAAPSQKLRQWFGHDPAKWAEFRERYHAELTARPDAWAPIAEAAAKSNVTLLFSAHDTEHNNAVALKEFLEGRMRTRPEGGKGKSMGPGPSGESGAASSRTGACRLLLGVLRGSPRIISLPKR